MEVTPFDRPYRIGKNYMLHARMHFTAVCHSPDVKLLAMEFLHCETDTFAHDTCYGPFSVLRPWPWPDDLRVRTWPVLSGDTHKVHVWTSYIKSFESYRLTDRQTYGLDRNYSPRRFAGGQIGLCIQQTSKVHYCAPDAVKLAANYLPPRRDLVYGTTHVWTYRMTVIDDWC